MKRPTNQLCSGLRGELLQFCVVPPNVVRLTRVILQMIKTEAAEANIACLLVPNICQHLQTLHPTVPTMQLPSVIYQ